LRADPSFAQESIGFWAYVRAIGEARGYTKRGHDLVAAHTIDEMAEALTKLGRSSKPLGTTANPTELGLRLRDYFEYRADILNNSVKQNLMTATEAKREFELVKQEVGATNRTEIIKSGTCIAVEYSVSSATQESQ